MWGFPILGGTLLGCPPLPLLYAHQKTWPARLGTPASALTYWTPHEQRLSRVPVQWKVKHGSDSASACGRVLQDPEDMVQMNSGRGPGRGERAARQESVPVRFVCSWAGGLQDQ